MLHKFKLIYLLYIKKYLYFKKLREYPENKWHETIKNVNIKLQNRNV